MLIRLTLAFITFTLAISPVQFGETKPFPGISIEHIVKPEQDHHPADVTPVANFFPCTLEDQSPRIVREEIEWLDVWVPGNSNKTLPKVLLIGDSIARGYYKEVEDKLKGRAIVARLTSSKSLGDPGYLAEVKLILSQTRFDVIHFNNGLHGWGYSEDEYAAAFPELLATIRTVTPKAKLIWASTTPIRQADKLAAFSDKNERVRNRNKLVARLMVLESIPIDDLYAVIADKPEWYSRDGVHLNAKGVSALATQVAEAIGPMLSSLEQDKK